jgi:hypothetical protein
MDSTQKENLEMVLSQIKSAQHHADELAKIVKSKPNIEAWVVAKMQRASTDLSDITHYLDGLKMKHGGQISINEYKGTITNDSLPYLLKNDSYNFTYELNNTRVFGEKKHLEWAKNYLKNTFDIDSSIKDVGFKTNSWALEVPSQYVEVVEYKDGGNITKSYIERELEMVKAELNHVKSQLESPNLSESDKMMLKSRFNLLTDKKERLNMRSSFNTQIFPSK